VTHIYVFNIVQGLICLYALTMGGWPERCGAILLLAATGATLMLAFEPSTHFRTTDMREVAIDIVLMGGLITIAMLANRFWPLWLAALHLLGIGIHGVRGLDANLMPWMYGMAEGKIAYPMLGILGIGVLRHQIRVARHGRDPDWAFSWRDFR